MTVLVTGGAGYIGSHMVHALADAGEPVVVVDDLSTGFRSALPATVPLFVGDVGDQHLVASIIGEHKVNAIIHFAGDVGSISSVFPITGVMSILPKPSPKRASIRFPGSRCSR